MAKVDVTLPFHPQSFRQEPNHTYESGPFGLRNTMGRTGWPNSSGCVSLRSWYSLFVVSKGTDRKSKSRFQAKRHMQRTKRRSPVGPVLPPAGSPCSSWASTALGASDGFSGRLGSTGPIVLIFSGIGRQKGSDMFTHVYTWVRPPHWHPKPIWVARLS